MPPKLKPDPGFDLICTICPKVPQFSDVSHLLTHLASKAHLHHQHSLQVSSIGDPTASTKLEQFEAWYAQHNFNQLLAKRQADKEKKRNKTETVQQEQTIKHGTSNETKPQKQIEENTIPTTPDYKAPIGKMQWEETQFEGYETPTMRRQLPAFGGESPDLIDPNLASPWNNLHKKPKRGRGKNISDDTVEEKVTDCTKLKGKKWDGMGLWDAGTLEMKKIRNQKKPGSVLMSMMRTSAETHPTESVYDRDGVLQRTRDIFGPNSCESSPTGNVVSGSSPKRVRKSNKPSASSKPDLLANVPRLLPSMDNNLTKNPFFQDPIKRDVVRSEEFGQFVAPNPLKGAGIMSQRAPDDHDEEYKLTAAPAKKRNFSVFHDDVGVSPVRTEASLEETNFEFTGNSFGKVQDSYAEPSAVPVFAASSVHIGGKENRESVMINGQNQPITDHPNNFYPPSAYVNGPAYWNANINPLWATPFMNSISPENNGYATDTMIYDTGNFSGFQHQGMPTNEFYEDDNQHQINGQTSHHITPTRVIDSSFHGDFRVIGNVSDDFEHSFCRAVEGTCPAVQEQTQTSAYL